MDEFKLYSAMGNDPSIDRQVGTMGTIVSTVAGYCSVLTVRTSYIIPVIYNDDIKNENLKPILVKKCIGKSVLYFKKNDIVSGVGGMANYLFIVPIIVLIIQNPPPKMFVTVLLWGKICGWLDTCMCARFLPLQFPDGYPSSGTSGSGRCLLSITLHKIMKNLELNSQLLARQIRFSVQNRYELVTDKRLDLQSLSLCKRVYGRGRVGSCLPSDLLESWRVIPSVHPFNLTVDIFYNYSSKKNIVIALLNNIDQKNKFRIPKQIFSLKRSIIDDLRNITVNVIN
ncbi:hypothetical protein AGLY_016339 [Aphis glycines]|uniref:Uncharacterized protein n=1 Tax=Aphis glycines TaxID=307491 RepID=A0A6G0SY36_APHGL|nr:hypothetical protein AGLY_016339 [Aphis glycines]